MSNWIYWVVNLPENFWVLVESSVGLDIFVVFEKIQKWLIDFCHHLHQELLKTLCNGRHFRYILPFKFHFSEFQRFEISWPLDALICVNREISEAQRTMPDLMFTLFFSLLRPKTNFLMTCVRQKFIFSWVLTQKFTVVINPNEISTLLK